jgi:hypothetical protein
MSKLDLVNKVMGRFNTAWGTTGFPVSFTDVPLTPALSDMIQGENGVELTPWARCTIRTAQRKQETFGANGNSGRIWLELGAVFIEIYSPTGQGLEQAYELAEIVKNAFEGVSEDTNIFYRDFCIVEAGAEGVFSHLNVTGQWEYRESR